MTVMMAFDTSATTANAATAAADPAETLFQHDSSEEEFGPVFLQQPQQQHLMMRRMMMNNEPAAAAAAMRLHMDVENEVLLKMSGRRDEMEAVPAAAVTTTDDEMEVAAAVSLEKREDKDSPTYSGTAAAAAAVDEKQEGENDMQDESKSDSSRNSKCWLDRVCHQLVQRPKEERRLTQLILGVNNNNKASTSTTTTSARPIFVLVSGPSGTGRASVVQRSLQNVAAQTGGYFITGKVDILGRQPAPYAAFLMALEQFIQLVVQRGPAEIQLLRQLIQQHVGTSNVAVLQTWLPSLRQIMGGNNNNSGTSAAAAADGGDHHQDNVATASSSSSSTSTSVDRFAYSLKLLRKAMSCLGRPIYLCLENLHLADQCTLDLLSSMLRFSSLGVTTNNMPCCAGCFSCVATCDDRVIPADSPVAIKLREIEDTLGVSIVNISMTEYLTVDGIDQALRLKGDDDDDDEKNGDEGKNAQACSQLAKIVYERTGGHYFLSSLFLQWMQQKGMISYQKHRRLVVDQEEIDVTFGTPLSSSVFVHNSNNNNNHLQRSTAASWLVAELEALPMPVRDVLKVAACLGYAIPTEFVALVLEQSPQDLEATLAFLKNKLGLLIWCPKTVRYCFAHDGVQEAAYQLIPVRDRPLFQLEIGRRLWRNNKLRLLQQQQEQQTQQQEQQQVPVVLPENDLNVAFTILEQIQQGRHLIKREKERFALADLCLYVGEKAASASSFAKALSIFEFGVFLLQIQTDNNNDRNKNAVKKNRPACWQNEHYHLTLALCSAAIEMQFYGGKFEEMEALADYTIAHARTLGDKMRAYTCKVNALSVRGRPAECVDLGLEVLAMLGFPLSKMLCKVHIHMEFKRVRKLLKGKSDEQLLRLPKITDRNTLEAMRLLSLLMFPAMGNKSPVAPLTMVMLMKLTLQHGHSIFSPIAFVSYANFRTEVFSNNVDEAYRFGQLALKLQERESRIDYLPRVYSMYYGFIHGWKQPVKQCLGPLLKAHSIGVEYGDLEFASVAAYMWSMSSIETGQQLDEVHRSTENFVDLMVSRRQDTLTLMSTPFVQYIRRLIGSEGLVDLNSVIEKAEAANLPKAVCIANLWKMRIAYIFGDVEEAGKMLLEVDWSFLMTAPQFAMIGLSYVIALIACSNIRISGDRRTIKFCKKAVKCILKKFRQWARDAPHEVSGKFALIQAEVASIAGRNAEAREKYTNAILISKGMENNYEVATSHERAMLHYRNIKDDSVAIWHGEQAHQAYLKWGATAKAAHFKKSLESFKSLSTSSSLSHGTVPESTDCKGDLPAGSCCD